MADIVTVGLAVNDDGTAVIKQFGDASEKTAAQTDQLEAAVRRTNGTMSAGTQRAIADAQRALAARQELYGALTSQTDAEFFAAKAAGDEATAHTRAGTAAIGHGLATGKLTRGLEALLVTAAGANPHLAQIGVTLSHMAVGGPIVLGVLAGLAAIAYGWEKITEKSREADKQQNDAVKNGLDALRLRALGPGGDQSNVATAAAGRISDLKREREEATSLMGRNVIPSEQRERLRSIDSEVSQLQLLIKDAERQMELARTRSFAEDVGASFDYAVARGKDVMQFYDNAKAAQDELNKLAQSGNRETRNAALQGLQQISAMMDRMRLQGMGLAEPNKRLLGMPAETALGGIKTTGSNLSSEMATAARHGGDLAQFSGKTTENLRITSMLLGEQGQEWTFIKQQLQDAADQAQVLADATILAAGGGTSYAAKIRNRASNGPDAGALGNAQAQKDYGAQLALRESMLKLPPVFDADREAAVRHGETMRNLSNEIEVAKKAFSSVDAVIGSFKEGLKQVALGLLQQFSPANLAQNVVGGLVSQAEHLVSGLVSNAIGGIRHAIFGSSGAERTAEREQRENARAMKLTLDAVKASLTGDTLQGQLIAAQLNLIQVLNSINAALPGVKNEAERNRERAEAAALEAQQEAKIKQQDAQTKKYATEDLDVRNLRALGRGDEADRLAFQEQQQREMQAAIDAGRDATYLNTLATTQNNELIAFLNGTLSEAVRNAPTGFFANQYYQQFATPKGYPTDSGGPIGWDTTGWNGGGRTKGGLPRSGAASEAQPIVLVFRDGAFQMNKDGVVNIVLDRIDQQAAATGGSGSSRARALETLSKR